MYRNIFGFHKWESVKEVICRLGRLDLLHITNMRQTLFYRKLLCSDSALLNHCFMLPHSMSEISAVQSVFNVRCDWSEVKIKAVTFMAFKKACLV